MSKPGSNWLSRVALERKECIPNITPSRVWAMKPGLDSTPMAPVWGRKLRKIEMSSGTSPVILDHREVTGNKIFGVGKYVKKSLISLEGRSITPCRGYTFVFCCSQQVPCLHQGPFWNYLQRIKYTVRSAVLCQERRSQDNVKNNWHKPWLWNF